MAKYIYKKQAAPEAAPHKAAKKPEKRERAEPVKEAAGPEKPTPAKEAARPDKKAATPPTPAPEKKAAAGAPAMHARPKAPAPLGGAGLLLGLALFVLAAGVLAGLIFWVGGAPAPQPAEEAAAPLHAALEKHTLDDPIVIVLDAGHGGETPFGIEAGAVDPATGTIWESVITDAMVQRVAALLERHGEAVKVVRSAPADTYASPLARANTATAHRADLLLSLHLNAEEYPYYGRGFSCFPTPPGRVHHQESLRFGQLLVERVRPTGLPIMGESGIFYHYYIETTTGGFYKQILDAAEQEAPRPEESFGVVEYAGCPAVLAEMWFISSEADMALMHSEEGYDAMAQCLYLAICDYFGLTPPEEG